MTQPFTHLRAHTEFSIVESTLRVDELIARAKADGQPAVPMTDLDGFFGAIPFYEGARSEGIKPILGTDIQIALTAPPAPADAEGNPISPNPHAQPPRRALLIAKDYQGYLKLMRLISRGYTANQDANGKPVLKEEWLREESPVGLYCLSGTEAGHIGQPALAGDLGLATENAHRLKDIFGDNFFIEVQRRGAPTDEAFVQACLDISKEVKSPLVATHPIQFSTQEDYVAHELKVCDARKVILPDRARARDFTPYQHFTTTAEMEALFADLPDALANARALAESCSLNIPLNKPELPDFNTGTDETLDAFFVRVTNEGLAKRMKKLYPVETERQQKYPEYQARLDHEINTIKKMGFEGYFMIVYDFINWAHEREIPVGPGRGSGAGSLVAYSLGITDLDPLKYNLLFERFLNPERVSMPDFDIDFCVERRELVIDYVTKKYGVDAVAGITAVGTLKSRAAVAAAGRALGMSHPMFQGVAKLIPNKPGMEMTVQKAIMECPEVIDRYQLEPEVKRLLDHAATLEGLPKSVGKHAAGVVIARGRIADYSPVYVPEGETQVTTQYDKNDLEKAGLVKFDFLGLKNLTMIDKAVRLIKARPGQENFDLSTIPLDDPEVYKLFQRADTLAVFQFASDGIRGLLRDAQPANLADLTALNALYRPGPMDLMKEYCINKATPNSVTYLDPRMKDILSETYGIMIYQEQVMQMAQTIGGYTLGGADLLRRAMGKKKPEEMAKHRSIFIEGAQANGVSAQSADKIFSHMEKFAGYGFNKSHSAAYAVVAYQTAYLKVRHPAEYFAAVLSVESVQDVDAVPALISDAKSKGITVLAPDINLSEEGFTAVPGTDNHLLYGLEGIKGIGRDAVRQMLHARRIHGKFESLEDFVQKCAKSIPPMGANLINKTVVERLISTGCFDAMHPNRAESIAAYPLIDKYNKKVIERLAKLESRAAPQALGDLFAMSGVAPAKAKPIKAAKPIPEIEKYIWPVLPEMDPMDRLENERKAFGFYFSGHPMASYRKELPGLKATESIAELLEAEQSYDDLHLVGGVVSEFKAIETKNGKMAKGFISDGENTVEFVAFADAYGPVKDWFKKDSFGLFTIQVKEDKYNNGANGYNVTAVRSLEDAKIYLAEKLNISIPKDQVPRLKEIVKLNPPGAADTTKPISLWHPTETSHEPSKEPTMLINLNSGLISQLQQEFGKHVNLGYPKNKLSIKAPPRNRGGRQWKN